MKRIARGLSLACITAAVLVPTMGTASAASAVAQASAFDHHRHDRRDCDHDRGNNGRWHNGYYYGGGLGYYGGGLGLCLGILR